VPRHGLTLLEMVLALALFMGAITVLAQVAWNGQRAAIQARLRTEAAFRCETKLAEILAGVERFQSQPGISFPDDPQWTWSAQIAPGQLPELLHVKVIVHHQSPSPAAQTEFVLERWTRDPTLFLQAAAQTASSLKSSATSSTTTSTSGGSK
jgi:Tfp pilus assembly protein PilE